MNFRSLFESDLITASEKADLDAERQGDMLELAVEKKKQIMAEANYEIDDDRAKAIDDVVKKARKLL